MLDTEHALSFLDIQPVNYGHTLVIPRQHYSRLSELDEQVALGLYSTLHKVYRHLKDILREATGFNILLADGIDAGQEIFHVHYHIIPRTPQDGFGWKFGPNYGKKLRKAELEEIASTLRISDI
ncbi:MAG TPA: HIT family protein [Candidatus Hodarchaeales archaeon]|nr:HIT family protein [Candidatus Hodarchaeales archaeon]